MGGEVIFEGFPDGEFNGATGLFGLCPLEIDEAIGDVPLLTWGAFFEVDFHAAVDDDGFIGDGENDAIDEQVGFQVGEWCFHCPNSLVCLNPHSINSLVTAFLSFTQAAINLVMNSLSFICVASPS